jgi:protein-disulfide isomerase
MRPWFLLLALTACNQPVSSTNATASSTKGEIPGGKAPSPGNVPAVVASWDGGSIAYSDFSKEMAPKLARLEADYLTQRYEAESGALDEKINEALLDAEVKKLGLADKEALLKQEVEGKVAEPTEAEILEAYNQLSRRLGGKPLEEVRDKIVQMVKQKNAGERYQAYIEELRSKYHVDVALPYPDLPRIPVSVDDDPSIGPKNAQITIVQFAEFQCPYCGKARDAIDQVMKDYEGKVQFVFRDFPLSFHDRAIPAAIAANCAGKQDKYWPVHDAMMRNQRALQDADLERIATEAGVDLATWNECRKDPAMAEEVRKDMADGEEAGVTGTPAFFINGVFLSGAQPYEKFKAIIDRELSQG